MNTIWDKSSHGFWIPFTSSSVLLFDILLTNLFYNPHKYVWEKFTFSVYNVSVHLTNTTEVWDSTEKWNILTNFKNKWILSFRFHRKISQNIVPYIFNVTRHQLGTVTISKKIISSNFSKNVKIFWFLHLFLKAGLGLNTIVEGNNTIPILTFCQCCSYCLCN